MRRYAVHSLLVFLLAVSCSHDRMTTDSSDFDLSYGDDLSHEMIVLGSKLENPYKTINIQSAVDELYPTKASRLPVQTTDLYVRFLPTDDEEFSILESLGIELLDHPVDYDIVKDGDWYHDPTLPEGTITWQYALVPKDFVFPPLQYEILDECFIHEHSAATKSFDVDWSAIERKAYEITGNEDKLQPLTRAGEIQSAIPSGRICIVDPGAFGGKPIGVSGVRVMCNSFVRFDYCYTDRDGYYTMSKNFSSELKYRLVFKNEKSFSIGFNFLLVPASMSTLGKCSPEGVNMVIDNKSEAKLFRRCVVNNAAYDYICRAGEDDLNLPAPPSDLRIWIFNKLKDSSCIMMHHGTVVDKAKIASFLGSWSALLTLFAPDITIGTSEARNYSDIYSSVVHEMAHATHFSQVGKSFWSDYIFYILESFVKTGDCYGDGTLNNAGICEIGEMWAYYLQSKLYYDRYAGVYPSFGKGFWFKPQIFRYLEERGLRVDEMAAALEDDVISREALSSKLISLYPSRRKIIEQVFNRYN